MVENILVFFCKGFDRVGIFYVLNYVEYEIYEVFYGSFYGLLLFGI